ncbi:MAG: DNA cytosine methyltransferase, partial [Flavobacteriaceae bacterium]|nr:DNA cytosine methyltransferase [Flavobacteriaceae bacterium]
GLVFNEVQTDLEAEGYEVLPILLPVASKNAEHKRERIWFIAYSRSERLEGLNSKWEDLRLHKRTSPTIISYRDVLKGSERPQFNGKYLRINDGIPSKLHKESIRALGNAIVPQIAFNIFRTIQEYNENI